MAKTEIQKLLNVMKKLRDPQKGCPWDKKQTIETIIPHTIEEVYEVAEQVYNKNFDKLKEELGDLLFQVIYISQIASEKRKFNFNDVVETITSKMIPASSSIIFLLSEPEASIIETFGLILADSLDLLI